MTDATKNIWHTKSAEQTLETLSTDAGRGLSSSVAAERLATYGPNQLTATASISAWEVFVNQFKNILVVILLIGVTLSGFLGHPVEAIAIAIIVFFAILLGFTQEYRAERAMAALKQMAAPTASVIRDGAEQELAAHLLVPGDIILLTTGDRIPADARLIEAVNLKVEEASLTGESIAVEKHMQPLPNTELSLGDKANMVFAATSVAYGRGLAVVVTTGMQTEMGAIAGMLQTVEQSQTPLQKNLDTIGKRLAQAALIIVALIVAVGFSRGQPLVEILLFGIALAVAVVPEALPAVVTISLSIGVRRMVKRNALVRRLTAVETLGATSVICTDKTGTLTKDEMTVRRVYLPGRPLVDVTGAGYAPSGSFLAGDEPVAVEAGFLEFLKAGALCSDARLAEGADGAWDIKGDPTEGALVVAAAKAHLLKSQLDGEYRRIEEIPFSSEKKFMSTLHQYGDKTIAYTKGAADVLIPFCTHVAMPEGVVPLSDSVRAEILQTVTSFSEKAMRVIALASQTTKELSENPSGLTFLGLAAMIDPPRPEAAQAVLECKEAGIKVMMITGDHPVTALAIAREIGIATDAGKVVTGLELERMSDAELASCIESIDVCARVSPAHKLRVVGALQARKHVVAMTGDGVNDAPALKKADIGIAMGISGTDVAKEAADMTLLDDNFASIVAAIEEGRLIFGNIKKYLMYLLSSNVGEIGIMAGATLLGLPLPLTAVQLLYVNLATDGLPALALAVDPPGVNLMKQKPRNLSEGIFTKPVLALMLTGGVWSTILNIFLFVVLTRSGIPHDEVATMVFVNLVLVEFLKAYALRSERTTMFFKPFANAWLNRAVLWEVFVLSIVVYVPFLHGAFGTFSLKAVDIAIIAGAAASIVVVLEIAKLVIRKIYPV